MCLALEHKAKFVYKVYKLKTARKDSSYDVVSLYLFTKYTLLRGKKIISDRSSVSLTDEEITTRTVHQGLHVFLSKEDAMKFASNYNIRFPLYRFVVVEFYAAPTEQVAVGGWQGYPSAVYHRLQFHQAIAIFNKQTSKTNKPINVSPY